MSSTQFEKYEDSVLVPDQSAWEVVSFWHTSCGVTNFQEFLTNSNIQVLLTVSSAAELAQQIYNVNLFGISSTTSTTSVLEAKQKILVLSYINLVPTTSSIGMGTFPITVWQAEEQEQNFFQPLLWDATQPFQRMLRNKRSPADISNISLGRYLSQAKENFFVFTNDNGQINQCKIEGFRYIRPGAMLLWLLKEGYIKSKQKAVWVYKKMQANDPRSLPKNTSFKDL